MKTGVWLHGDSLSKRDPALRNYPEARSVFVFDRPFLEKVGLSFKRIFFLYECAVEAVEEMRVGETVEEILDWVRCEGLERVAVTESPSPRWRDGGEVEAEGGGGGRTGGGDGDRAGGISREEVHAVLEGFGEGVGVGEEWDK